MARSPLFNLRLDDATRDRWTAAAQDVGLSLAAFIRETVDAAVEDSKAEDKRPLRKSKKSTATQALKPRGLDPELVGATMTRPGSCERERHHRPGAFCKACGT